MKKFILIILLSLARFTIELSRTGAPASPPGLAGPPAPPSKRQSKFVENCTPGETLPGPTCTSFYMCVETRIPKLKKLVHFECGPGTYFSKTYGNCGFWTTSVCRNGSTGSGGGDSGPQPPSTSPSTRPTTTAGSTTTANGLTPCPFYTLDQTSVYDCIEEGKFPHLADCTKFYLCIHTMNCVLKGFLFTCPPVDYRFDEISRECKRISKVGPCDRVADSGFSAVVIRPIAELKPDDLNNFALAAGYWDFMPFLPNETQRILQVPADFSRDPSGHFSMGGDK